ncbi:MAG TPA: VanW family protein [Limnochordia bacterium]|nr:VanW family protein [Limnochordia bacterium]
MRRSNRARTLGILAAALVVVAAVGVVGGWGWLAHRPQLPASIERFFKLPKPEATAPSPDKPKGCDDTGPPDPDPKRLGAEVSGWPPGFDDPVLHQLMAQYDTPVLMAGYKTNFDHAIPSQAQNIALTAQRLAGTVVQPGAVFSQNQRLGPYTAERGYGEGRMFVGRRVVPSIGGGVCQIATTLYNAVVAANLPIVERHNHSLTVAYVPPGRDATVAYGYLDFKFRNDRSYPLVIWASTEDRWLYIGIFGREAPPEIEWHHETLSTSPYPTEVYLTDKLPAGEEKVLAKGLDGITVKSWITIGAGDDAVRKEMGIDTYQPSPRVIERGPPAVGDS